MHKRGGTRKRPRPLGRLRQSIQQPSSDRRRSRVPALRRTSAEVVAEHLRHEILRGELEPGVSLPQNTIAERFGVSTTPVREAFALLQSDGLVEIDRYRGVVVFRPTVADLRNSYELREVLETFAIAKAVPRLTTAVIDELDEMLVEMRSTAAVEQWMDTNDEFHHRIYAASDNPRLTATIASQHASSSMYIYMNMTNDGSREAMDGQHVEILEACRLRDVAMARQAVRRHLQASVAGILLLLEQREHPNTAE